MSSLTQINRLPVAKALLESASGGPLPEWDVVQNALRVRNFEAGGTVFLQDVILPLFSVLLKPPIMRTSCLAAGPLSSVAQTSSG